MINLSSYEFKTTSIGVSFINSNFGKKAKRFLDFMARNVCQDLYKIVVERIWHLAIKNRWKKISNLFSPWLTPYKVLELFNSRELIQYANMVDHIRVLETDWKPIKRKIIYSSLFILNDKELSKAVSKLVVQSPFDIYNILSSPLSITKPMAKFIDRMNPFICWIEPILNYRLDIDGESFDSVQSAITITRIEKSLIG